MVSWVPFGTKTQKLQFYCRENVKLLSFPFQIMIFVAWVISLLLCAPQAVIFQGSKCLANFAPGWGMKAYVTWFSLSNFFIPLFILFFCYSRICYDIWHNERLKYGKDSLRKRTANCVRKAFKNVTSCGNESSSTRVLARSHETDGETVITTDPDAILAIEKLQRRGSSSSDSSIESADRPYLMVNYIPFFDVFRTFFSQI